MNSKKLKLAIVLALLVSIVWSVPVSASIVYADKVRNPLDRWWFGNYNHYYYTKYDCCRYSLSTMKRKQKSSHYKKFYMRGSYDHAVRATDSYNRRTTGWRWAKCYTHYAIASIYWYNARGSGIYDCRWDGKSGYARAIRWN